MKLRLPPPIDLLTILVATVWLALLARYLFTNVIDKELFGTVSGLFGTMIGYQVSARKKKDDEDSNLTLEKKPKPPADPPPADPPAALPPAPPTPAPDPARPVPPEDGGT